MIDATGNALNLVNELNDVHRNVNGARVLGNGAADGLTNPPGGIGTETEAPFVVKFLRGSHKANISFLDQIQERETLVRVAFSDAHDEAQVSFDEFLTCA